MTSWIVRMVNVEVKVGRMLMMAMIKGEDVLLVKGKDDIRDDNGDDEDEDLDNDTKVDAVDNGNDEGELLLKVRMI